MLVNDSGFLGFIARRFKRFIQWCCGFFFFFFLERVRDKLLINLGFYSPSVKNAIYLKGVALSRSDLGGDYSLQ